MTVELAPLTLGAFESIVRAVDCDPDDLLFGCSKLPSGAATPLAVASAEGLTEGALSEILPLLTAQYVTEAQRHARHAQEIAAFYADRSGGVGGSSDGSSISLARLVSREKPSDWHALRTMPLREALLYLLMRGVDGAAESWD